MFSDFESIFKLNIIKSLSLEKKQILKEIFDISLLCANRNVGDTNKWTIWLVVLIIGSNAIIIVTNVKDTGNYLRKKLFMTF